MWDTVMLPYFKKDEEESCGQRLFFYKVKKAKAGNQLLSNFTLQTGN